MHSPTKDMSQKTLTYIWLIKYCFELLVGNKADIVMVHPRIDPHELFNILPVFFNKLQNKTISRNIVATFFLLRQFYIQTIATSLHQTTESINIWLTDSQTLSPWMWRASLMSLGMLVTLLAWMVQRLTSSKSPTRYASATSCSSATVEIWNLRPVLKSSVISHTESWNGRLRMRNFVLFWYIMISRRTTSRAKIGGASSLCPSLGSTSSSPSVQATSAAPSRQSTSEKSASWWPLSASVGDLILGF